ncbi:MAG: hypothetical protein Q7W56_01075 [Candidatus Latescibacteria bacterium]|nr:hypothetical protein [Candidatus Latescibacterota bacterium]
MRRDTWVILVAAALALVWGQGSVRAGTAAAVDSVGAASVDDFWRTLDPPWYEPLTVRDLDFGLSDVGLDSLVGEGDHVIARMIAGRPWQLGVKPLERFRFNRVEGLVLGGEVRLARAGVRQASLTSGLDYGFAWRRCTHSHKLDVPLLTAKPRDAEGFLVREPWVKLAFEAEGGRTIERFGGDRRPLNDLSALIAGDDPSQYYEMEAWRVGGRYSPHPALTFTVAGGEGEHRGLGVRTEWSLFGGRDAGRPNEVVPGLERRSVFATAAWRRRGLEIKAGREWHWAEGPAGEALAAGADDDVSMIHDHLGARWIVRDRHGDLWVFRGEGFQMDGRDVTEWRAYFGGLGTLEGLEPGTLFGRGGVWGSMEFRWNVDLLGTMQMPLFGRVGLQPAVVGEGGRSVPFGRESRVGGGGLEYYGVGVGVVSGLQELGDGGAVRLFVFQSWVGDRLDYSMRIVFIVI